MGLNFLIVEGNVAPDRKTYSASFGRTASQSYADVLANIAPYARSYIVYPADADAGLPAGAALLDYDAVFITGSALNLYDGGPAVTRQIALARAVFAAHTPMFGSCWGLQVAVAAAGGEVFRNARGREIGLARDIRPTAAGREHALLRGRPPLYAALCSHIDIVTLPEGATVLASNAMAPVQAAEIVCDGGRFWGVQYHPEYSFAELAAIVARRAPALAREGLVADVAAGAALAEDLRALDAASPPAAIVSRLGLDAETLDPRRRRRELTNFLQSLTAAGSARGG